MANHKSAKKRARQTITKTARNSQTKKTIRTVEKKLRTAISENKSDEAKKLLVGYTSKMAKAAQKGMLHMNNASRKIGRLSKAVSSMK